MFAAHLAFSVAYNAVIPLKRGPDEESHYFYIQHLLKYRSLPQITRPHDTTGTRDERSGAIAIHPPLYYVTALPVYAVSSPLGDEGRQRALRLLATVFAVGTLIGIRKIAQEIFPENIGESSGVIEKTAGETVQVSDIATAQVEDFRLANHWMQVAVVGFAGLLPHFLLLSSVINNDGLFILLNTLLMLLIVRSATRPGPNDLLFIGAVFGLCLICKGSAIALGPMMLVIAFMHSRLDNKFSLARFAANLVVIFGPAFLIAGWWYLWYFHVHGRMYLIPKDFGPPLRYDSVVDLLVSGNAGALIWRYLVGISQSIWSQVDWILPNDPNHPEQAYSAAYPISYLVWLQFMFLLIGSLIQNAVIFTLSGRRAMRTDRSRGMFLCYLHFGLYFFALMYSTLLIHPGGYQGGRYLLPGIAGFALFLMSPWSIFISWVLPSVDSAPHKLGFLIFPACFTFVLVFWNWVCIRNLVDFLIPTYA